MEDVTKSKKYGALKNIQIKRILEANPELSLAEASSRHMTYLRECQAKKRELLKDFAPEKAQIPIDKMLYTTNVRKKDRERKLLAEMDFYERQEYNRRKRKGLPPIRDQVTIPLNAFGGITPSKVLNNIADDEKPASIKEAFQYVFMELQAPHNEPYSLMAWAKLNPTQFYLLITKLIPSPTGTDDKPITIKSITFE